MRKTDPETGTAAFSAKPPPGSGGVASPRAPAKRPTSSPTAATVPETSAPGVNGSSGRSWYSPRQRRMSKKFRAAASTSTITSPGAGSGSSTSSSFRTSEGSPSSCTRQARILGPPSALPVGFELTNSCLARPGIGVRWREPRTAGKLRLGSPGASGIGRRKNDAAGKGRYDAGRGDGRSGGECRPGLGNLQGEEHPAPARGGRRAPDRHSLRPRPARPEPAEGYARPGEYPGVGADTGRNDPRGGYGPPAGHDRARGPRDLRAQVQLSPRGRRWRAGRHNPLLGSRAHPRRVDRGARDGKLDRGRGSQRAGHPGGGHRRHPGPAREHSRYLPRTREQGCLPHHSAPPGDHRSVERSREPRRRRLPRNLHRVDRLRRKLPRAEVGGASRRRGAALCRVNAPPGRPLEVRAAPTCDTTSVIQLLHGCYPEVI